MTHYYSKEDKIAYHFRSKIMYYIMGHLVITNGSTGEWGGAE